ncbi:MAG: hypothetical protein ACRCTQ_05630 [Brevinemataceae bacterium]
MYGTKTVLEKPVNVGGPEVYNRLYASEPNGPNGPGIFLGNVGLNKFYPYCTMAVYVQGQHVSKGLVLDRYTPEGRGVYRGFGRLYEKNIPKPYATFELELEWNSSSLRYDVIKMSTVARDLAPMSDGSMPAR